MTSDAFPVSDLVRFVHHHPRAVLATLDTARGPEAALLDVAVTDEGELVLDSRSDARKVANVTADPRVALVVGVGEACLQVEGDARVVDGAERERYGRVYEARFPDARALADGFAVVVVRPRWARLYDASGPAPRVVEGPVG